MDLAHVGQLTDRDLVVLVPGDQDCDDDFLELTFWDGPRRSTAVGPEAPAGASRPKVVSLAPGGQTDELEAAWPAQGARPLPPEPFPPWCSPEP